MRIAVPVDEDEEVDPRWGKAHAVAVAEVVDGAITSWGLHEVEWDRLHDEGAHGTHHARIVRFLLDNEVETVVIRHAGAPMLNTMAKMGLRVIVGESGPAREAVLRAASSKD